MGSKSACIEVAGDRPRLLNLLWMDEILSISPRNEAMVATITFVGIYKGVFHLLKPPGKNKHIFPSSDRFPVQSTGKIEDARKQMEGIESFQDF